MTVLRWSINDGKTAIFWIQFWMPNEKPLIVLALLAIHPDQMDWTVNKFVAMSGQWDWPLFTNLLPQSIILIKAAIPPLKHGKRYRSPVLGFFGKRPIYVSISL